MTTEPNDKRPSHIVWQVTGDDKKAFWTRIGAAWQHKKDSGLNVRLDAIPLSGRVVIMERREDDDQVPADAPAEGDQQ